MKTIAKCIGAVILLPVVVVVFWPTMLGTTLARRLNDTDFIMPLYVLNMVWIFFGVVLLFAWVMS